jgi:hypothetical protein
LRASDLSTISSSERAVGSSIVGNEVSFSRMFVFHHELRIVGLLCTVGEDVERTLGYLHYSRMLPNYGG